MTTYPFLDVSVETPMLRLRAATDELLEELAHVVRAGKASADPAPYDDPMSFYEPDPDLRVAKWLQAIWRGRGMLNAQSWRLFFVVVVDDEPIGMQDIIGVNFTTFGTVATFSWVSADHRRRGIGREMRSGALQLAFDGLAATEASSEAFVDNHGSNAISRDLGYESNGVEWATRGGEPALMNRWRLTRDTWAAQRRDNIRLRGVEPCRTLLQRL
ncbi:GNAT family N-acetyltransferase [Flexivirga oryzae]|uniref:RimJ/RimL family protein N-acetyltransferase n=1 Tax=Flexivirga oryzae TaxID=1794944 RepID=A0A839N5N2_9MICO|nr:GNAT family protein [Flexivirga oryzae]MBB2890061.1 RimJ/RimL family protein N-acetyltransferase [Flexivirga oryzae]